MELSKIKDIVAQMTLEEKASLCSGADFWHTKKIDRLEVPEMMVSDGPHGLRKQDLEADHLGINDSIKAVCFPAGCGAAASFNRELIHSMGVALGKECQSEDVGIILGPAANIKRSPLCGRNFEYYSEDPYLAGEIAASHINGVQSQNVGTSLKHFMANNQETRRMSVDARISERALHEIYLRPFEGAVRASKPWTIMSSYNKVNGKYVGENAYLLKACLRDEWGFDGFVVSDWGAVGDRIKALEAGLDLEMPDSHGVRDTQIVEYVKSGKLAESVVDEACLSILNIVYKATEGHDSSIKVDFMADHELAGEIAKETIVLLKNDNNILPLSKNDKVAFIGKYAKTPRFQGGGSSHINCVKVTSAMDAAASNPNVVYAQGFNDNEDVIDETLEREAIKLAGESEVVVIFAGLPDAFESEGFDRKHMRMPNCQLHLIEEITKVSSKVVVVLHNGSPIEMPWANKVSGILESYLGGEAVGIAQYDILYGNTNPSGRLAETFPIKLEDNPSFLTGFGEGDSVDYSEGIYVGYRYYDKKKMDVLFPFGYGLSYTAFEYSNLTVDKTVIDDTDSVKVSVDVKNTGDREGKEVVQLYVACRDSKILRAVRELKNFDKVSLMPGESKTVSFVLSKRDFAYYEPELSDWYVESGEYDILIGKSSRDIVLEKTITVNSTVKLPFVYTEDTTCGDVIKDERAKKIILPLLDAYFSGALCVQGESAAEALNDEMNAAMIENLPLHAVMSFGGRAITPEEIKETVRRLNEEL